MRLKDQRKTRNQCGLVITGMALAGLFYFAWLEVSTHDAAELPAPAAAQNSSTLRTARFIIAGKGGELTAASGQATLTIPPGHLPPMPKSPSLSLRLRRGRPWAQSMTCSRTGCSS